MIKKDTGLNEKQFLFVAGGNLKKSLKKEKNYRKIDCGNLLKNE